MPALMMRTCPAVWRSSSTLLLCLGVGACELAQRDFAPVVSSETPADGGASRTEVSKTDDDGETSARPAPTGTDTTTAKSEAPTGESAASPDATSGAPVETSGNVTPADTEDTDAVGDTSGSPQPADTSHPGQETSTADETTGSRCDQNLLTNGNFEAGEEGWTPTSSYEAFEQRVHPLVVENGHESLTDYAVTAHDGTHFAFLGDVPDDQYMGYHTTLTQSVFIPEEAIGVALIGYIWVDTDEPTGGEWDIGYAQLESQENAEDYWQFAFWTNLQVTGGWVKFDEYIDELDQVRGKHVNLVVQAVTDDNTATRYWFDELELVVVCE